MTQLPQKDVYLHVRISQKEKKAFDRACLRSGETMATVIRRLMRQFVEGVKQ